MARTAPPPLNRHSGAAAIYARTLTRLRFGGGIHAAAERARAKVRVAVDRLDAELDAAEGDYLVGDSFGVAVLTAASLFYPLVLPEEGPLPTDEPPPAGLERFRKPLKDRRRFRWVAEMFPQASPALAGGGAVNQGEPIGLPARRVLTDESQLGLVNWKE